jgi:hypothetical protein
MTAFQLIPPHQDACKTPHKLLNQVLRMADPNILPHKAIMVL